MDPHKKPPASLRSIWRHYRNMKPSLLETQIHTLLSGGIIDGIPNARGVASRKPLPEELRLIFQRFMGQSTYVLPPISYVCETASFTVPDLPGLVIFRSIFPPKVQLCLLDRLMHRDLSNCQHLTNVHLHYDVPYATQGASYFSTEAQDLSFQPIDASLHKPFSTDKLLDKKLRWVTLGGQYDWTNKEYPSSPPPPFPSDVKRLLEEMFPLEAEAAILNVYSPGDTLSLHRDISEQCDRPLVSVSIGCDAIFICALNADRDGGQPRVAVLRLRSGDAVLMSDESRYAWHGVPRVLEGTCPSYLHDWPAVKTEANDAGFERWRGWMRGKRINLNVRQMYA